MVGMPRPRSSAGGCSAINRSNSQSNLVEPVRQPTGRPVGAVERQLDWRFSRNGAKKIPIILRLRYRTTYEAHCYVMRLYPGRLETGHKLTVNRYRIIVSYRTRVRPFSFYRPLPIDRLTPQ